VKPAVLSATERAAVSMIEMHDRKFEARISDLTKKVAATSSTLAQRIRNASPEEKAAFATELDALVEARVQERVAKAVEPYQEALDEAHQSIARIKKTVSADFAVIRSDLEFIKALPVPGGPLVRRMPGMQSARMRTPSDEKARALRHVQVLEHQLATASPVERADLERSLTFARSYVRQMS
jgi:hypothetical protein